MAVWLLVLILIPKTVAGNSERVLRDVPYRNQVDSYPDWPHGWSSCGYTCMVMSILYNQAVPENMNEIDLLKKLRDNCSVIGGDIVFYNWNLSDEFCRDWLPEFNLQVNYIIGDYERQFKESIDRGWPVIVGTYIFGDVGHVILLVGYDDNNWIVHDPANAWGKEYTPESWWTENAAFVTYPKGSFTCLYGVVISSDHRIGEGKQKIISIWEPLVHLGDSYYEGEINEDFVKPQADCRSQSWHFDLSSQDLAGLNGCCLQMKVAGAQRLWENNQGNPVYINGVEAAEIVTQGENPDNNHSIHQFYVFRELLREGTNIILIRAWTAPIKNGNRYIDFDDFEISEMCLRLDYGDDLIQCYEEPRVVIEPEALVRDEPVKFEVGEQDFSRKETKKAEKIVAELKNVGGQIVPADDERQAQIATLLAPLADHLDKFQRIKAINYILFESPTIDPIGLPDGTLLIPTGFIRYQRDKMAGKLDQAMLFPIISALVQADRGISYEQVKRKDKIDVVGFFGSLAKKITGNDVAQYAGTALELAAALTMETEDEDFYLADAWALDILTAMGLSANEAYTYFDATDAYERDNPDNLEVFYMFAPPAEKRLNALIKYDFVKNVLDSPISPGLFDFAKAAEK